MKIEKLLQMLKKREVEVHYSTVNLDFFFFWKQNIATCIIDKKLNTIQGVGKYTRRKQDKSS